MKTLHSLFKILFLIIIQFGCAQIKPIETVVDDTKIVYSKYLHDDFLSKFNGQSNDLLQKISKGNIDITDDIITTSFFEECLEANSINFLKNNKITLIIEYVTDENGIVLSCSLIDYGKKATLLSNVEIESVLEKAMSHKFNFGSKPENLGEFYSRVWKYYRFNYK